MPTLRSALQNGLRRLYHYQPYRFDHLENTMRHSIIRFSRARNFNDPWDCKPSFNVPVDRAELERLVRFMDAASRKLHTPGALTDAEREAQIKHYLDNPSKLRTDMLAASAEMWVQMDRCYRIYCLSATPTSQLLWGALRGSSSWRVP